MHWRRWGGKFHVRVTSLRRKGPVVMNEEEVDSVDGVESDRKEKDPLQGAVAAATADAAARGSVVLFDGDAPGGSSNRSRSSSSRNRCRQR